MLMEVDQFCENVEDDLSGMIDSLVERTGRSGDNERRAWQRSLPKLSVLLANAGLDGFHVQIGQPAGISLEYQLPVSSSWADAVLLGRGADRPCAVVIELKDWDVRGDAPAQRPGLIRHHNALWSHPSDQVRGYAEYCRSFHSVVLSEQAVVTGCVFFTSADDVDVYRNAPYQELVAEYPVFSAHESELRTTMPAYLRQHLHEPDYEFATRFEHGGYAQDRNLLRQVSDSILGTEENFFVLLDQQRLGFELCLQEIDELIEMGEKSVIVVEGPPGSGKSVLAAKLWATLVKDPRISGNIVMVTTSSSQRKNWESLFRGLGPGNAGGGIIVPANRFNPGLSPVWVKDMRASGHVVEVDTWQENLQLFADSGKPSKMPDDTMAVSIVDEAHALIDPTVEGCRGIPPGGWAIHAGPQAWHIQRGSQVSIFLMDGAQSFRDNELTTQTSIREWAADHGIKKTKVINLSGSQFRCGGSEKYVTWLEQTLGLQPDAPVDLSWRKQDGDGAFVFDVVNDPEELEDRLRVHVKAGHTSRLLSTYSRDWLTKNELAPHGLPAEKMDFNIPYTRDEQPKTWSRIWNYAPKQDYTFFVQAPAGSMMSEDPLCEVGCPYVVRGFDYDFIGLLWLEDLVWRGDRWCVDPESVFESAIPITRGRARAEILIGHPGVAVNELLQRVLRSYRILLSRAIRGAYVWIRDEETRMHIESRLTSV